MKLASIFTNGMVLQRNIPIKIFGSGTGAVCVELDGEKAETVAKSGKWCATLSPKCAGGPYKMRITSGDEEIIIDDIMIGDVYIAGGQSNMEMPLFKTEYGFEEAKNCENSQIRYFTVARRSKPDTDTYEWHFVDSFDCDTPWQKCSEETALTFSAIGHYFAKFIHKEINIPIGIISCNWGGRRIETFIAREYFGEVTSLDFQLTDFEKYCQSIDMDEYEKKYAKYLEDIKEYITVKRKNHVELTRQIGIRAAVHRGGVADKPCPEYGSYDSVSPATLWETMFSGIVPYGIRGLLWYQGESNAGDLDYTEKYLTFLKCIKEKFECDIDAYAVELAPWVRDLNAYMDNPLGRFATENNNWAFLREQQQKATEIAKNNYLVTTHDIGDMYDIHPMNKKDVAYRLALKALKYTYGKDISADQPIYKSAEFKDGGAYITLENGKGLFGNLDGVNMYIAGKDRVLHKAVVEIKKDNLLFVHSEEVFEPVLVRYGFDMYYIGSHIYNEAGLPLAPFRTDS